MNRFVVFLLTVVAMTVAYALSILSYSGLEFTEEAMMLAVFFFVVMAAPLLAFVLAGQPTRKLFAFTSLAGRYIIVVDEMTGYSQKS